MTKTLEFPDTNELENLLQWGRYLFRTSLTFELYRKSKNDKNNHELLYLSHSLLYVCIEAFKAYDLTGGPIIDYLLSNKFADQSDVIRNLRNSIFHPEKENDIRQENYLKAAERVLPWALALLFEFERFLYFYFEDKNMPEIGNRFRKIIKLKIGWLPNNSIFITTNKKIKKLKSTFKYLIKNNPEQRIQLERELKNSVDNITTMINDAYIKLLKYTDIE
jgi:hypothetical protein